MKPGSRGPHAVSLLLSPLSPGARAGSGESATVEKGLRNISDKSGVQTPGHTQSSRHSGSCESDPVCLVRVARALAVCKALLFVSSPTFTLVDQAQCTWP